jgi:hypothetical protein
MTSQQQFAGRRVVGNGVHNPVPPASQPDLRSTVENLLRDAALVLHATAAIRRLMNAEQALCPAVSG